MYIYLSSFKQFHYFQHDMTTAVYIYIERERERENSTSWCSALWQHVNICVLFLQSCDTWRSVFCVCSLATRADLCIVSTPHLHLLFCALCLHSVDTCRSVCCFYTLVTREDLCIVSTLATRAGLFIVSTFRRHVQPVYCVYTLATRTDLCNTSTLRTKKKMCIVMKHTEWHVSVSCDTVFRGKASFIWSFTLWRQPETDLQLYIQNSSEMIGLLYRYSALQRVTFAKIEVFWTNWSRFRLSRNLRC